MTTFLLLIRPLLPYILVLVAFSGTVTSFYLKIQHDEKVRVLAKVEKEKQDAIDKGNRARARVQALCKKHPNNCTPDDEFLD